MKKSIIECDLKPEYKEVVNTNLLMNKAESFELIEILKIDFEKITKLVITKIIMKEDYKLEELDLPGKSKIISILKHERNQYICLVKGQPPMEKFNDYINKVKKLDLNLVWTTPMMFDKDKLVISIIGMEEELKVFYENWKEFADIKKISIQQANFEWNSILSCLTDKQREIIINAKRHGYYNYPRKINSEKLAKRIGLSKATTIEHLRKAENRLVSNILTGY